MKKIIFILAAILTLNIKLGTWNCFAQRVAINSTGAVPNPSALLDVDASPFNDKGILIPRVSLTDVTVYAPITGASVTSLLVYNTNATMTGGGLGYWYWDGTKWAQLGGAVAAGNAWLLLGNAGTVDGINFIGTTDNIPFNIRVNNQKAGRIDALLSNTFFGYQAGNANTTGNQNTANGADALRSNTTGNSNTANGFQALYSNSTSFSNVAVGVKALFSNTTRSNLVAIGDSALYNNGVGAIGLAATANTAVGSKALYSNTTGMNHTAIGYQALYSNPAGWDNTAVGYQALYSNQGSSVAPFLDGNSNTAVGYSALYSNTTGHNNTSNGENALLNNTTGNYNTATGSTALVGNTTGSNNTANGYSTLVFNTTGINNTANGAGALRFNTTGNYNTSTGNQALYHNLIGNSNTANGNTALYSNFAGNNNTAIGDSALYHQSFIFVPYSSDNVAVGHKALFWNNPTATTNAIQNTAIGNYALQANITGNNNTALGYNAFNTGTAFDNSMALGANALAISASNMIRVGDAFVTSIGGQAGWTTISDARVKKNVQENVPGLAFINELRPVTYHFDIDKENEIAGAKDTVVWEGKYDIEKIQFSGFLAQDVDAAARKVGYGFSGVDKTGTLWGLRYAEFVVPLVQAVQELNAEKENLKSAVESFKSENQKLQTELFSQQKEIEQIKQQLGMKVQK